jgi:hypothetical protein
MQVGEPTLMKDEIRDSRSSAILGITLTIPLLAPTPRVREFYPIFLLNSAGVLESGIGHLHIFCKRIRAKWISNVLNGDSLLYKCIQTALSFCTT